MCLAYERQTIYDVKLTEKTLNQRIAVATGIVMASALLSLALGFCREWTIAHQIGSNAVTDAYYAAFTLPDFLNYLVAGGALSVTFIPVFARYLAEKREDEGWRVFSTVVTVMGLVLVVSVSAAEVFADKLVKWIAPGFPAAETSRVVTLTRLMLPAQICLYEGSILSAVQYAKGQFVVPSLAPLVYNMGIILGGVLLSSRIGIIAVGVLGGAIAGTLLQIYGAYRVGVTFSPSFRVFHPGFLLFLKLSVPIMLAVTLSVADDWIIRWFGSYLKPPSITWLTYGKTVMRVPLGIVGHGLGIASFPILAELYSQKRFEDLNRVLNGTFRILIILLVPISALTIAESLPLVHLIFSHTRLRDPDFQATGVALAYFSIGMFAWGVQNIIARGFFSMHDTVTPAIVGTLMTLLNIPIYWWLARRWQYRGLALASSLGIIAYTIILFVLLKHRTRNREVPGLVVLFLKMSAVSIITGIVCRKLGTWLQTFIQWRGTLGTLLLLTIVSLAGILLLWGLTTLIRVREISSYLRRTRSAIEDDPSG